ncbi:hypothetical protein GCM10007859_25090 [Brevundimonas denitrificans]|uniref:Uncharacterized protein n=1 Tax=Brevundimonas denitrificans TaxID=1443434 RepID=A0ABQ6BKB7_9CAUL|nr:hypothetical protein GCM10007859_25090 [Brevundimonas denitrificans]
MGLAEQAQQDGSRLVGDAERLDTQLLLGLQGGQSGAFLGQIGIDEVAETPASRASWILLVKVS